jgi:hypothetical protein
MGLHDHQGLNAYKALDYIIKMVPFMSGDRSKCHPEKTLLPEALAPWAKMFFE